MINLFRVVTTAKIICAASILILTACQKSFSPVTSPRTGYILYLEYNEYFTSEILEGSSRNIPLTNIDGFTVIWWDELNKKLFYSSGGLEPQIDDFEGVLLLSTQTSWETHSTIGLVAQLKEWQSTPIQLDSLFTIDEITLDGRITISFLPTKSSHKIGIGDTLHKVTNFIENSTYWSPEKYKLKITNSTELINHGFINRKQVDISVI